LGKSLKEATGGKGGRRSPQKIRERGKQRRGTEANNRISLKDKISEVRQGEIRKGTTKHRGTENVVDHDGSKGQAGISNFLWMLGKENSPLWRVKTAKNRENPQLGHEKEKMVKP